MENKRFTIKLLAIIMIFSLVIQPCTFSEALSQASGVISAGELYLRKGPGTDYENVLVGGEKVILTYGQEVTILGEKDGWYHIRAVAGGETVEGYSLAGRDSVSYITVTDGRVFDENTVVGRVTAVNLNLRTGPSIDYEKVKLDGEFVVFKENQEVTILGEKDGWYHVKAVYEGSSTEGYCHGSYVELINGSADDITAENGQEPDKKEDSKDPDNGDDKKTDDKKDDKTGEDDKKADEETREGYELTIKSWNAKFNFSGTVSAKSGLNMRKSADSSAEVTAVLDYKQKVEVIKTTVVTTKDDDGNKTKTRWYRVVADTGEKYIAGYVNSEYITLKCGDGIAATTKYSKQVLLKTAKGSAKNVKTSKNKVVKLGKNTEITILKDVVGSDGIRYFKVKAKYKKKDYTGYIPALRVALTSNATTYSVQVWKKIPEPASTDEEKADEPEPPVLSFEGANAMIAGSAGLAVSKEPKGSSERLFTADKKLILLYDGDSVEILNVVNDGELTWCNIRFYYDGTEYNGYIRSSYIEAMGSLNLMDDESKPSSSGADFETELEREGFPESYKEPLRALHALYPSWKFKAYHTGLDWAEAVAAESKVGVNLIPNSKSVEWKSLEAGAYSWKTDTFTVFDGSTWVTASKEAIEYYMDPRNFLNYDTIFQYEILTYSPEFQDYAGVANILKNTALSNTSYSYKDASGKSHDISYENTFLMAAEYTGVSPFHLASRVKQEVVIGTNSLSNSVTGTVSGYEGLYNYYNIGAYHSTEAGGAIRNGLKFAQSGTTNTNVLIPWTDPFRAILGGAFYIGNNYINRGQNTIYLQKFNTTTVNTYAHQYMANVEAPYSEGIRVYRGYVDPGEIPVVFSIPVYLNMPAEKCGVPEKKLNPNNWLKTLKIYNNDGDKLALTPTFDYTVDQEYSLIVDSSTDCLKIKATTVSSLAQISGAGDIKPETGVNRYVVSVTAQNGEVREYIINVVREESTAIEEETNPDGNTETETQQDPGQDPEQNPEQNPEEGTADSENDSVPEDTVTQ